MIVLPPVEPDDEPPEDVVDPEEDVDDDPDPDDDAVLPPFGSSPDPPVHATSASTSGRSQRVTSSSRR
jgi:hypothetical protein